MASSHCAMPWFRINDRFQLSCSNFHCNWFVLISKQINSWLIWSSLFSTEAIKFRSLCISRKGGIGVCGIDCPWQDERGVDGVLIIDESKKKSLDWHTAGSHQGAQKQARRERHAGGGLREDCSWLEYGDNERGKGDCIIQTFSLTSLTHIVVESSLAATV